VCSTCDGLFVVCFGANVVLCADLGHTMLFCVLTLGARETRVRSFPTNEPQPSFLYSTIHRRDLASMVEHRFCAESGLDNRDFKVRSSKSVTHHARKHQKRPHSILKRHVLVA
jgi:hypothetical protein